MKSGLSWRPYRFMPLSQLMSTDAWKSGASSHMSAQMHASVADGFEQGMNRGYREGHESGLRSGYEVGLSQGREEGRRQGLEEGRKEALARFEAAAAPIDAVLQSLRNLQADYQAALRKEVVELVAKVARQVIRCELALQPTQLLTLVDETLATLPPVSEKDIEIYLNSEELERIRELAPERAALWNLMPDPHLEHGECRIKAGTREADAGCRQRLAACMEQIAAQLLPAADVTENAA